nr:hypothetical protein [Desulfobacteraceae bacterium]
MPDGCDRFLMTFQALSPKRLMPVLALLLLVGSGLVVLPAAAAGKEGAVSSAPPAADLWQAAEKAAAAGRKEEAAGLFDRVYRLHRGEGQGEEALWREVRLRDELALGQAGADWGAVRDLYRLYTIDYPQGAHFEEAYLGLGLSHFRMYFFREAAIYFKLFLDRFPQSSLRVKATYWQGPTLFMIGR